VSSDRRTAWGLFVLTLVAYASFFNGAGWNANASFDLTRALVEDHTLHIDRFAENTGDVSFSRGHVYSNKPPGLSFLAAIPYSLIHLFAIDNQTIVMWLLTVLICGTTGALIPVLLFTYGRRNGIDRTSALIVALTIAVGTYVFAYATVFFTHVPCAALLLLAFVWLDGGSVKSRPLLAGIAAGIAGTIFYVAIPAAAVLAVLVASRSMRRAALFVAGGIPFGIFLAIYHNAAFGSPWQTSVETSSEFTSAGLVFGVLHRPRLDAIVQMLIGWQRGLLPLSPVLLFAIIGAIVMIRRRVLRRELAAIAIVIAIFIVTIASFNNWHGGSAIGPRYVLPIVPFLGVLMLFAAHRARPAWIVLGALSFAINFVVVAVDVAPGGGFQRPLQQYIVPLFIAGRTPENYPTDGSRVAVNPQTPEERCAFCTYPFLHPRTLWASFNLGELILPRGSAVSVLLIALWIVGGAVILLRMR